MNFGNTSAFNISRQNFSITKINSKNAALDSLKPLVFERSGTPSPIHSFEAASLYNPRNRVNADSIRLQSRNIHTGINLLRNDPRFRGGDLPIVSFAINRILSESGIPHRFSGSMASALHGARRRPVDVDVEVMDKHDLKTAMNTLSHFDDQVEMPDGTVVHMRGERMGFRLFQGNEGGMIKMTTTHSDGREAVTWVDLTNENHRRLIGGLNAPNSRGIAIDPRRPNYLSPHELIANYLDRMMRKPRKSETKEDSQQIIDILRNLNFDLKNPFDVESVVQEVSSFAKTGKEQKYADLLREIIAGTTADKSSVL